MSKLGILTNEAVSIFHRAVIEGVEAAAGAAGHTVAIHIVDEKLNILSALSETQGIIVIANALSDSLLEKIADRGIAISLVSHRSAALPSIIPNNRQGIARLMEHLITGCGCTRPLFIRGDSTQTDALEREAAFQHEVMRYNLRDVAFINGDFSASTAASALDDFLQTHRPFDCVLAADYLMGCAALTVLRESGCRVPEDVKVVGFGDGTEAAEAGLTTVAADIVELGRRAARQLIYQLQGSKIRGQTLLSTTLVIRQTTCNPE